MTEEIRVLMWPYLLPAWISPMLFGRLKLWQAQSMVNTPVAASPRDSRSGLLTMSWLTQLLHWWIALVRLPKWIGDSAGIHPAFDPSAASGVPCKVPPQQNNPILCLSLDLAHRWTPSYSCENLHWAWGKGHIKIWKSHQHSRAVE